MFHKTDFLKGEKFLGKKFTIKLIYFVTILYPHSHYSY
jgi:hypothetical protein